MKINSLIVLGLLSVISCSKEYDCNCTHTYDGGEFTEKNHSVTAKSKSGATEKCEAGSTEYLFGSTPTTINCKLK